MTLHEQTIELSLLPVDYRSYTYTQYCNLVPNEHSNVNGWPICTSAELGSVLTTLCAVAVPVIKREDKT